MSLSTPILTTPSETWAFVPLAAKARATAAVSLRTTAISSSCVGKSDSKKLVNARPVRLERGIGNHVHHASVLDDVVPVRHGLRAAEILLDQQDGEALLLEPRDGASDLLHDHRREPFGGLVEQQQARAGAQYAPDRQHLLLSAGELGALAAQALPEVRKQLEDLLERKDAPRPP